MIYKYFKHFLAIIVTIFLAVPFFMFQGISVEAAPLTNLSDSMSRLKIALTSNHEIKFVTPSGVAAGQNIIYTFDPAFTLGAIDFNDVDFAEGATSNCSGVFTEKTLAAAPVGATWGVSVGASTVTITSGTDTINPNRCVRLKIGTNAIFQTTGVNQITNPATAGSYSISMSGTFGDSGTTLVQIITDDQVAVTANVGTTLSFSISDNIIDFDTLNPTFAKYATPGANSGGSTNPNTVGHSLSASANSTGGYTVTVKGATLTSGANSITAIGNTATASTPGTEQFGLRLVVTNPGPNTGAVVSPYHSATDFAHGADANTTSVVALATTPTSQTNYDAYYVANIDSLTEAGSYSTTLTYVATANF